MFPAGPVGPGTVDAAPVGPAGPAGPVGPAPPAPPYEPVTYKVFVEGSKTNTFPSLSLSFPVIPTKEVDPESTVEPVT